jgi:hypothetical protein
LIGWQEFDRPIDEFRGKLPLLKIDEKCEWIYQGILNALNTEYPDKVLSVLFKSPVRSKKVFEMAIDSANANGAEPQLPLSAM